MKWFTNRRYKLRHLGSKDSTSNSRRDDNYDDNTNDQIGSINKTIYRDNETTGTDDRSIISEKSISLADNSSTTATTSKNSYEDHNRNIIFYEIID